MKLKSGYKQTEVGLIPEDWKTDSLSNVAPLQRGFDLPTSQLREGNYPVVYSNGVLNRHSTYMAKAPGVVTGRSGTIGKVNYIETDYWPHNTTLWVTNFKGNDPKFIYYLYHNVRLYRFGTGSGVPTLNRNDVHVFRVPVPPAPEQRVIAAALSDVDDLICSLGNLITKKRAIKQAAMQQLLTGKVRLPGFNGDFEVTPLKDLCWYQEGPGVRNYQFTKDGVKLLNGTNIVNGKIVLDTTNRYISEAEAFGGYKHFLVDEGDILIASSGITIDRFQEKVAFAVSDNLPLCMNTSTIRFKTTSSKLSTRYLYFFLQSDLFKDQIEKQATGSAQLNFGPAHLNRINVKLPQRPEEQTAIATVLSDMDAEIAALEQRRDKTRAVKQGMMQELLTGKTRLI